MSAFEKSKTIKDSVLFNRLSKVVPSAMRSLLHPNEIGVATKIAEQIISVVLYDDIDVSGEVAKFSREYYEFAELQCGIQSFIIWERLQSANHPDANVFAKKAKTHFNNFMICQKQD
jgi:hypothetical protein